MKVCESYDIRDIYANADVYRLSKDIRAKILYYLENIDDYCPSEIAGDDLEACNPNVDESIMKYFAPRKTTLEYYGAERCYSENGFVQRKTLKTIGCNICGAVQRSLRVLPFDIPQKFDYLLSEPWEEDNNWNYQDFRSNVLPLEKALQEKSIYTSLLPGDEFAVINWFDPLAVWRSRIYGFFPFGGIPCLIIEDNSFQYLIDNIIPYGLDILEVNLSSRFYEQNDFKFHMLPVDRSCLRKWVRENKWPNE